MAPAEWNPADFPTGAPLELTSRLVHGLDADPGNPGTMQVAPAVPGATRSARPIALRLDGSTTLRHTAAAQVPYVGIEGRRFAMPQGIARLRALAALLSLALFAPVHADDWQPVAPEDLTMQSEPKAPKASAIYLYRQVDRDDAGSFESTYSRIKILTDEGRQYANVEIPYLKGAESIRGLQARVIHPDGSATEFDGTIYEKPLVKARGAKMMSKSFTLPNVDVGSIIEYRYRRTIPYGWAFNSRWLLSDSLFTRRAVFSLRPADNLLLRWSWPLGLPPDTKPPEREHGLIRLETHDVPAFVSEEYMPPEDAMKYRVQFIYEGSDSNQKDEESYWKAFAKRSNGGVQRFLRNRALEQEVARLVQPGDSAETKATKLYARAQQIRNLSFERQATEQETERDKLGDNGNVEDLMEHGYAHADEITWFLYGLLRAAKLDASLVLVSTRDDTIFDRRVMNSRELKTCVVLVNLGDSAVFLDPGTPFMPFAYLPWSETAVPGLRLGGEGVQWVTTTLPSATESRVERKMVAKLSKSGTLEGKVVITYSGLEASRRRVNERNEDATERRKFLEQDLEGDVPVGVEDLKLTNTPDWGGSDTPLVAEFELRVPGWAAYAGKRVLMPMGLFGASEKHTFEHSARVHPLYFMYPSQHTDEAVIELPPGWQVSSLPKARTADIKVAKYESSAQTTDGTLSVKRELALNTILIQQKFYDQVRDFYQAVRAGDEDQIVITPGEPPRAPAKH
jgi:hypothetical protein